jgi:hypothetical protein
VHRSSHDAVVSLCSSVFIGDVAQRGGEELANSGEFGSVVALSVSADYLKLDMERGTISDRNKGKILESNTLIAGDVSEQSKL